LVNHIEGEEHRLMVLQNGAVTKVFGPNTNEVKFGWQKLQTEERYSSGNVLSGDQIGKDNMGVVSCTYVGEEKYIRKFGGEI
jgi:hypothetical protein